MRRSVDTPLTGSALACRRRSALRLGDERGAALIEFALVLPLLLLLVLGMLDLGRALNYWIDETQLASEGARLAAVAGAPGTCPNGTAAANLAAYVQCNADTDELRSGGTQSVPNPARVCISFPNGTTRGQPVRVSVTTTFNWLPLIGSALGSPSSSLVGHATMRLEQDWPGAGEVCS